MQEACTKIRGGFEQTSDPKEISELLSQFRTETKEQLLSTLEEQPLDKIKETLFKNACQAIEQGDFKMNGDKFLQAFLQNSEKTLFEIQDQKTFSRLFEIQSRVPEKDRNNILVLFLCLEGDLIALKNIVYAQNQVYTNENKESFYTHFLHFLSVYADVSQYVKENSQEKEVIKNKSIKALKEILSDASLQQPTQKINIFEILRKYLEDNPGESNLWLQTEYEDAPFDIHNLYTLIHPDIPREILARVIVELNNYAYVARARDLQQLIKKAELIIEGKGDTHTIEKDINEVLISGLFETSTELQLLDKINSLKDELANISLLQQDHYTMPDGNTLSTQEIILRLIDPEKILNNQKAYKNLELFLEELAKEVHDEKLLRQSLEILLSSNNPTLEIPTNELNGEILYNIFLDFALKVFETQEKMSWFPMKEQQELEKRKDFKTNYDTAGAGGIQRISLIRAAKKMVEMYPFERLKKFAETGVKKFYRTGGQYEYFFYNTATDAFNEFIHQCLPDLKKGDQVVISTQEFSGLTKILKRKGVEIIPLGLFDPNKNFREIIQKKKQDKGIDLGKVKLALISSKTRFGGAPISRGNEKTNTHYLAQFIKYLRKRSKNSKTVIAIDGCQALNRQDDPIMQMRPDVYFSTASKAMGAGEAAFITFSKEYQKIVKQNQGHPFEGKDSTIPIKNIVAMILGMQRLRSKFDLRFLGNNFGEKANLTKAECEKKRLGEVTEYGIKLVKNYAQSFLEKVEENAPDILKNLQSQGYTLEKLHKIFACQIVHPAKSNKEDYIGVITVAFPNLKGKKLVNFLNAKKDHDKDYRLISCRNKARAIRLAPLNDTEKGFDHIFHKIQEWHLEILQNSLNKGKELRYKEKIDTV